MLESADFIMHSFINVYGSISVLYGNIIMAKLWILLGKYV